MKLLLLKLPTAMEAIHLMNGRQVCLQWFLLKLKLC
jgi:hypothetical protein